MKKLLTRVLSGFVLTGCQPTKTTTPKDTVSWSNVTIYKVNGKPLECLKVGHGASCNWGKYNKQFEQELDPYKP